MLLSLSRPHCAVWRSVQYSVLSFCSVTTHAHRKSRVRSNSAPTRNVYVTLVYLYLLAVALLLYLLHWSAPRYALLTFADNTALPGFLYLYTCSLNVSLHRIIISIHFLLIYAIWWALTHSAPSYLCMNVWQRRKFSFSTHTLKRVWRLNEDINTQTTSPELLWESLHERFTV